MAVEVNCVPWETVSLRLNASALSFVIALLVERLPVAPPLPI